MKPARTAFLSDSQHCVLCTEIEPPQLDNGRHRAGKLDLSHTLAAIIGNTGARLGCCDQQYVALSRDEAGLE